MTDMRLSPRIIQRKCGGWLAVSNAADPLKIGVAAASEMEAGREFNQTRERWRAILESEAAAKVLPGGGGVVPKEGAS